jgi:hypothetical protein
MAKKWAFILALAVLAGLIVNGIRLNARRAAVQDFRAKIAAVQKAAIERKPEAMAIAVAVASRSWDGVREYSDPLAAQAFTDILYNVKSMDEPMSSEQVAALVFYEKSTGNPMPSDQLGQQRYHACWVIEDDCDLMLHLLPQ